MFRSSLLSFPVCISTLWTYLNEFDFDLQVKPGDVCSQVGLCSIRRDQSNRSGILPYCLRLLFAFLHICFIAHQLDNNLYLSFLAYEFIPLSMRKFRS